MATDSDAPDRMWSARNARRSRSVSTSPLVTMVLRAPIEVLDHWAHRAERDVRSSSRGRYPTGIRPRGKTVTRPRGSDGQGEVRVQPLTASCRGTTSITAWFHLPAARGASGTRWSGAGVGCRPLPASTTARGDAVAPAGTAHEPPSWPSIGPRQQRWCPCSLASPVTARTRVGSPRTTGIPDGRGTPPSQSGRRPPRARTIEAEVDADSAARDHVRRVSCSATATTTRARSSRRDGRGPSTGPTA